MQPLRLTLKGFRGIRDGLGREEITLDLERLADGAELIAIAGANGSGKSTIMDNLVPFMVLQSRAGIAGPGGFSYYDHVYLPESLKDLTWSHEGHCYRSQIVVRMNGSRRKTEAFLHGLDDDGNWRPVRIEDGTVSDGRVESYTRCVEHVCGSAETFFTSVFAAQGKRQLNTYRNAEIKTLLADLLGQEAIRCIGQKAGEVARLLKAGLGAIRQEQAGLAEEVARVDAARQRLDGAPARNARAEDAKQVAQTVVDAALQRHARLSAEREQSRAIEARRGQLIAERRSAVEATAQAVRALQAQDLVEAQRLERLEQRVLTRQRQEQLRRQTLTQSQRRCRDVLGEAGAVDRAVRRLALAQRMRDLRRAGVQASREKVQRLVQCQGTLRLAEQRLTGIEREAGKAVLRTQELTRRFGLTAEVPCAGTELQGRCKLLGDAREAQALMPDARTHVARCAQEREQVLRELAHARRQCEALIGAPQALAWDERREARTGERASRIAELASKEPACSQARTMLGDIDRELVALGPQSANAMHTPEEQAEREQIAASRKTIASQLEDHRQRSAAALARLDRLLGDLAAPCDERQLAAAAHGVTTAREALRTAEQFQLAAVRDGQGLEDLDKQSAALAARREGAEARCAKVENELANWNLLARCMSNDGLIALAIDDAGPALSALANDLLLACYGPRFTVSIHTLLETGKGEQKEGFDIVVHDGTTGDAKSVGLMSGGERTFVEACLTRAIALYLAMHTGRRYTTLFTDEADGALDPDRKRMFMAMKREVLRLGGYEREFFVSQTPELTAMADDVIDLDAMKADGRDEGRWSNVRDEAAT
jgi:exonuclease SbcC